MGPVPRSRTGGALFLGVLMLLVGLGGCQTIGYYAHVAGGQLTLLVDREPVDKVLARLDENPHPDPDARAFRDRLLLSQKVLAYAQDTMHLPVGGRYRSYVDLHRDAVVWNLFAAPPLSLSPHEWCYPFVGCAPYRGYFDADRAERARSRLAREGLETYVGPVAAYSTLGWFNDPLLSTFMDLDEPDFVELLLHELAHSRVWVHGDATFNESFATFVGAEGTRRWFERQDRMDELAARRARSAGARRARAILEETRAALSRVYDSGMDDTRKQRAKTTVLTRASDCLDDLSDATGNDAYRRLAGRLNNAYLASMATYSDDVPAFAVLFDAAGEDWQTFFSEVDALARRDASVRTAELARLREEYVGAQGDDDGTDEVQCQALPGHGLDGEATGAEDDDVRGRGHGQHESAGSAHGSGNHQQARVEARPDRAGGQDRHEQGGRGRIAGGLGEERHRQADDEHDEQDRQARDAGQNGANGLAQA
jgi:predicted aminopeptidase